MLIETLQAMRDLPRLHEITVVLIRHGFGDLVRRAGLAGALERAGQVLHGGARRQAEQLTLPQRARLALAELGPTFVKIGQALSTRPDMVPAPYIVALQRMQDHVTPVPFEAIREVFEAEIGVRLSKAFVEFDEVPLGCASLAQVHRAVLRDGRQVAVKVQRPDIGEMIRSDIDTLAGLAGRADRFTDLGRRLRFADWVHEFRKTLLAELDYRIEAENLSRFSEHFAGYPELFVPSPLRDLCAAFQRRVVDSLVTKAVFAAQREGVRSLVLAGGVAANRELRESSRVAAEAVGIRLVVPPFKACTDNAAMIAYAGAQRLLRGENDAGELRMSPNTALPRTTRKGRGMRREL
jgi:hypothetical protein